MNKEFDEELKRLREVKDQLKEICNELEKYVERVKLHTKAIQELQEHMVVHKQAIKTLAIKVGDLEKKPINEVMYG